MKIETDNIERCDTCVAFVNAINLAIGSAQSKTAAENMRRFAAHVEPLGNGPRQGEPHRWG